MPKKIADGTESLMTLHEKAKRLEAELDNARLLAGSLQRENNQLRLQTAPGLLRDATHALDWALKHPDYQPGGRHHHGALGTAVPVLKALQAATASVQKPVEVPAPEEPAKQPEQQGPAGE